MERRCEVSAKKYRTLGVGDVKQEGSQWRSRYSEMWFNCEQIGEKISQHAFNVNEFRAPIVKRKKAGKKK